MIGRIRDGIRAWRYARGGPEGAEREWHLLSQYHRALALPDWAVRRAVSSGQAVGAGVDVSVVLTCYNYAGYVGAAIDSVFASAGEGLQLELIVVDDASKDASAGVIQARMAAAPLPVVSLRTWWNVGVSRARNLGIANARGGYVFILDADNALEPGALGALHAAALMARADAAFGPVQRIRGDGTLDGIVSNAPFDVGRLRGEGNYIDAMALFRKSALLEVGGYHVGLLRLIGGWEDYAVWLELAERGSTVAFVDRLVGRYLVKPDSMVSRIGSREKIAFREFALQRYTNFTALGNLE